MNPNIENVVALAILVSTSFRLRNEDALIMTLRNLVEAVDKLEEATDDNPENPDE